MKPVMALITLKNRQEDVYCRVLSSEIDTTYAHAVNLVSRLEEAGLIRSDRQGRKKIIELTSKGEKYAEMFDQILTEIEEDFIINNE